MSQLGRKLDWPDGSVWLVTGECTVGEKDGNDYEQLTVVKLPPQWVARRGPNQWQFIKELSAPRPISKD